MGVRFFGQYLVDEGEIDEAQLAQALVELDEVNLRVGGLAVQAGYLTERAASRVNAAQRERDLPFGELARELGLLTAQQVDELLFRQAELHVFLGETLVRRGDVDPLRLEELVDRFKAEQAGCSDTLHCLPIALQEEPFFEAVLDLTPNLAQRVARLRLKLAPVCEWPGASSLPIRVSVEAELRHTARLGIAVSSRLGRSLAAGMSKCSPQSLGAGDVREAVAGFLELLARNAQAGLSPGDEVHGIGPPEPGSLPSSGFVSALVGTDGQGLLVMEPG